MVRGIGIDIVSVERMAKEAPSLECAFARRMFTKAERAEAGRRANSAEYLAGRFAAKKAVYKAVAGVASEPVELAGIEVLGDAAGCPHVVTPFAGVSNVLVSITHDAGMACAFAVAE